MSCTEENELTFALTSLPNNFSSGVDKSSSSPKVTPASANNSIASLNSNFRGGSRNLKGSTLYC